MKISAIICAAGNGERAGFGRNKLLVPLLGAPALYHTLTKFTACDEIIVAASPADMREITAICAPFGATVVAGGKTRAESVYRALKQASGEIVLIHDGARPFVTQTTIKDCIESVVRNGSAVCATPVTDTTVVAEQGKIRVVPARETLYAVQTPQGFRTAEIRAAYGKAVADGKIYPDDGSVYLAYCGEPHLFAGDPANTKLTYRRDFAAQYPAINAAAGQAIGLGADVHAFGRDCNYITLCGARIPSERGLVAHSDGDVAVHAVMDALLSAAGLKDIGHYFPDGDETYENADSMRLLEEVIKLLSAQGYTPLNLTVTIQAERPRLAAYIDEMKNNLAAACNLAADRVGISAGTCEKLGFVGQGLGITATAIALLQKTTEQNR